MTGERIYLRALELDDYKTSIEWRRNPEIWNMLGGTFYFVSEAYEQEWVKNSIHNSKDVRLAVCLKENNKYIGNVYATNINMINRSCSSHVLIGDVDSWGKGIAQEAMMLLLEFLFQERGLNRVEAGVLSDNQRSIRMHQKCGYKLEGIRRQSVFKNGKFKDQQVLSILREDYILVSKDFFRS